MPLTPLTYTVQSWDTAAKTGTLNDYSVCTTWGVTPAPIRLLLLHRWRERVEYPDLKRAMRDLAKQFKSNLILIEDTSAGQSVVQDLRREGGLPVVPIKCHKDKVTNAIAASGMIEAGMAQLPEHAEWDVEEYLTLMSYFPNAVYHDDDMDSTTIFLNYIREHQFIISTLWDRRGGGDDHAAQAEVREPGLPQADAAGSADLSGARTGVLLNDLRDVDRDRVRDFNPANALRAQSTAKLGPGCASVSAIIVAYIEVGFTLVLQGDRPSVRDALHLLLKLRLQLGRHWRKYANDKLRVAVHVLCSVADQLVEQTQALQVGVHCRHEFRVAIQLGSIIKVGLSVSRDRYVQLRRSPNVIHWPSTLGTWVAIVATARHGGGFDRRARVSAVSGQQEMRRDFLVDGLSLALIPRRHQEIPADQSEYSGVAEFHVSH
jgi:predicted phage terminase large subunit-like protein